MNYVYHFVPHNLRGSVLYPLNVLKYKFPNLYSNQVKKYKRREKLLEVKIPYLECLWNEVLHFSPVHPVQIRDALLEEGFNKYPIRWFEIDPIALNFNSQNTVIYLAPPKEWLDFSKTSSEFIQFSNIRLEELSTLPSATVAHYKTAKQKAEKPFLFHRVPHVLYRGIINLEQVKIISIS